MAKASPSKTKASRGRGRDLTFHPVPLPALERSPALWRAQVGPLLDQALGDGPDGLSLLTRFEIRLGDDVRYDVTLFCDDDGAVYRAGTLERVASFSQGGATGTADAALIAALDAAHAAWRKSGKRSPRAPVAPVAPTPPVAPPSAGARAVPRYETIYAPDRYELGKKLNAKATSGLLRIVKAPTSVQLEALEAFLSGRAHGFVVELGPSVPLSVLAHVRGVPFVVLAAGRKDWTGLGSLPASVRRLSIRKANEPQLAELSEHRGLVSIDLDAPRVARGSPALAHLEVLAWTSAQDASWASLHPRLRELGLRRATIAALPASPTVERLLLFAPSKLTSLAGIEGLPKLSYLRIDHPAGMKRLGDLSGCAALDTIHLTAAHRIGDLSGLRTAPRLRRLGVIQTQLDAVPFEGLKGKLEGGSFQLKSTRHGKELLAHLGVPFVKTHEIESGLFDER